MIDDRRPCHPGATRRFAWLALALTGTLLQACGPNDNGLVGPRQRVYAVDLSGGAKMCDVPKIKPNTPLPADIAIKLGNDGGWCGLTIYQPGPKPYEAGLLTQRPAHGTVLIHEVGDETRIDYTPDRGFAGTDSFTVKLLPGNGIVQVAATVTPS